MAPMVHNRFREMEYPQKRVEMRISLHAGGPEVSRIALGMMRLGSWGLSASQIRGLIERSIELDVTTFDHADIYGDYSCEALFGKALGGASSLREKIQLVTKCGIELVSDSNPGCAIKHYDTSERHIISSVERSLERLRTDYIDLLLIHRPDPLMQADEVVSAFNSLRDSGKVRFFGVSNFRPAGFELLESRLPFPLVTNQIECSVLETGPIDDGTLDLCQKRGIAPMAWSPLKGGALFGGRATQAHRVREELQAICEVNGIETIDRLAIAWLLRHPARIVPVLGTGKVEHIENAREALELALSREDWFRILRASRGRDVP